jgi:hypothetical protein
MAFIDIDYSIQTNNLLPTNKRKTVYQTLMLIVTYPLQWLNTLWAEVYIRGMFGLSDVWVSSTTYNQGDRVVGLDNSVYESLNTNLNQDPTTTSGYWYRVEDNFVGVEERIKYNAQILTFEYAINKWFGQQGASFAQPPILPDIYITTNVVTPNVFVVGGKEDISSQVYDFDFLAYQYVIDAYTFNQTDYTIWVKSTVYANIQAYAATIGSNADLLIRAFADKYNLAGTIYDIITY